ncbi:MAG: hypothetical protein QOI08_1779, partial [Actinomycetota bacterium]|nr:hypothetical protein [Actinomycetota bacterium]
MAGRISLGVPRRSRPLGRSPWFAAAGVLLFTSTLALGATVVVAPDATATMRTPPVLVTPATGLGTSSDFSASPGPGAAAPANLEAAASSTSPVFNPSYFDSSRSPSHSGCNYWNWYYCNDPAVVGCSAFSNGTCGEYGVDIPLAAGTPIDAPESGTIATDGPCKPPNYSCWVPGRVRLTADSGDAYPGVMGFGHVNFKVSAGQHVSVGQEIATVADQSLYGTGWANHVEFMYSPSGGLSQSAFTGGCSAAADPCGEAPSSAHSPWTVLIALESGTTGTPTAPVVQAHRHGASVLLSWTEPSPGVAQSYAVVRDDREIGQTSSLFFIDSHPGAVSHRYQVVGQNGTQTASSAVIRTSLTAGLAFSVDVNGDGKKDLVYVYPGSTAYIDTFLSNGNGTYTAEPHWSLGGFDARSGYWFTGDANHDGKTDLFYVYPGSTAYIDTFLSNGNGTYTAEPHWSLGGFDALTGNWSAMDPNHD